MDNLVDMLLLDYLNSVLEDIRMFKSVMIKIITYSRSMVPIETLRYR